MDIVKQLKRILFHTMVQGNIKFSWKKEITKISGKLHSKPWIDEVHTIQFKGC